MHDIPDLFHSHIILLYYPTVSVHVPVCACAYRQTDLRADGQTDRQAGRQADCLTDKWASGKYVG